MITLKRLKKLRYAKDNADLSEQEGCGEFELVKAEVAAGISRIPSLAACVIQELYFRKHPEMRGKIFLE